MTNLPGSRPVVTLYLDPAVALLPGGALAPFWGRFLVSFVREFERRHHAVVLDLGAEPDPASAVDAQSYVVAGARKHYDVDPGELPFGQLLVAPGVHPAYAPEVSFEHDYRAIADDLVALLPGVRELLLLRREGDNAYADRIVAALTDRVVVREISGVELAGLAETAESAELAGLAGPTGPAGEPGAPEAGAVAGGRAVLSFHPDPMQVAEWTSAAHDLRLVQQAEPFANSHGIVFLDLLGAECGVAVAGGVGDALAGVPVGRVTLPHRLAEWSGTAGA